MPSTAGEKFYTVNGDPVNGAVQMGVDSNGRAVPMSSAGETVSDPALEAAVGTPNDTAWTTGAGTLVALDKAAVNALRGVLTVALTGMLPAGNNILGALSASGTETPFVPISNATTGLVAGPTATTTPVALPAVTAASYRIRNSTSSSSAVAWRLATTNSGQSAVAPVANSTAGTGGTVGDKMLDPGGVEIFGLTAAQQTALAAGSLYLSAITPAGGSATIFLTPGTGA